MKSHKLLKSQKNKTHRKTKVAKKYNTIKRGGMDPDEPHSNSIYNQVSQRQNWGHSREDVYNIPSQVRYNAVQLRAAQLREAQLNQNNNQNDNQNGAKARARAGTFARRKGIREKPKKLQIPVKSLNSNSDDLVSGYGNQIYGTHQAPPIQRRRSEKQSIVNFPEYDNLINNFKIFVWDFDDTLVSKEKFKSENPTLKLTPQAHISMDDLILGYFKRNEANVKSLFFEPDFFVNLVSYLTSKGCSVYVASFGFVDNIVQILDALFISYGKTSPFIKNENVLGLNKEAYQSNNQVIERQARSLWTTKKLGLLDKIINDNPDLGILFFDDNHGNIDANNQKELVYGIKLDGDIGFHSGVLNKVSEYIDSYEGSPNKEILKNIAL